MFLDGCSVEEYTRLQVRDQVAIATREVTQQVTQRGIKAQVNNLKPFVPDINAVTEIIKKNEGFEDVTVDMVREYW